MKNFILALGFGVVASLAGPVVPRAELASEAICASGSPACCKENVNRGISLNCRRPSTNAQTSNSLDEACSKLGLVPSCCALGLAGISLGCKPIKQQPTCSPATGFNYTIHNNAFVREGVDAASTYQSFDPSVFTNNSPNLLASGDFYTGNPTFIGSKASEAQQIYNSPNIVPYQKTLSGRGYLYSPVAQNITFTIRTYGVAYVYTGDAALRGFGRDNWTSYYRNSKGGEVADNKDGGIYVDKGSYTPVRWVVGFSEGSDQYAAQFLYLEQAVESTEFYAIVCEPSVKQFTVDE